MAELDVQPKSSKPWWLWLLLALAALAVLFLLMRGCDRDEIEVERTTTTETTTTAAVMPGNDGVYHDWNHLIMDAPVAA